MERERSLYGSEFEVRLRNEFTQKAIAKECAEWMRKKTTFRSNKGRAPMQQFACAKGAESESGYMPLHGFTAVDLGYEKGNAVSNFVNKFDEQPMTGTWLALFDQIWNDPEKLEDVTDRLCDHIASVYQENSRTTGSTTTATSSPTSSPRTVSITTCSATPSSFVPAANHSAFLGKPEPALRQSHRL